MTATCGHPACRSEGLLQRPSSLPPPRHPFRRHPIWDLRIDEAVALSSHLTTTATTATATSFFDDDHAAILFTTLPDEQP